MQFRHPNDVAASIVALLALIGAIGAGYVAVAVRPTQADVEHMIAVKTDDKFAEVQRRFDMVDRQLNRVLDRLEPKHYTNQ